MIESATRRIQSIENETPDMPQPTGMLGHIGQIKLKPNPSTVKVSGMGGGDLESQNNVGAASDMSGRPGLLSNYLRLVNLDRKQQQQKKPKVKTSAESTPAPAAAGVDSPSMWIDQSAVDQNNQGMVLPRDSASINNLFFGIRRRRLRRRKRNQTADVLENRGRTSGFFTHIKKQPGINSRMTSPIGTPLANTPNLPFRHLSEALPFATSQRQMASACGTPLGPTRRNSISSIINGDVSTVPGMTIDSQPIETTLKEIKHAEAYPTYKNGGGDGGVERQSIIHAIDLLLLHQRFLVLISKAMMMYGSPLHHLEDNLTRMGKLLDLEVTASAIPGLVLLSFEDSVTHTSETKIIRCNNGWDMHRLDQTSQLVKRVVYSHLEVRKAVLEIEQIMVAPPIYPWYLQILNWGVIAWTLCLVCFGGSFKDSGISLALGLIAGLMNLAAQKFSGYTNFFEVSVCVVTGLLGAALSQWGCFGAISLSATVVLLPGLVMTTGVIELSSRHMIAGTVRIFYALLLAFIIAYGLLIGVQIYNKMAGLPVLNNSMLDLDRCQPLTKWSWFGTFPAGIMSICILVNIHWRHWFSVIVIAGVSYGVFWLFKFHLGLDDLAPVVASFVLGVVANTWSKVTGQTAYMILLPGEMFLVPGSVGVRGFSSILSKDGGTGAQLALQMITTCLSIMMGLFAGSFLVYPRGKQNSAFVTV